MKKLLFFTFLVVALTVGIERTFAFTIPENNSRVEDLYVTGKYSPATKIEIVICMIFSYISSWVRSSTISSITHYFGHLEIDHLFSETLESIRSKQDLDSDKLSNLFGCSIDYFTSIDSKYTPVPFKLRATKITSEDLETMAVINKIALNLRYMENILEGE